MARKTISNAAALRDSFEKNGIDSSIDIHQAFLMNEYRIDMSRQQISQYRSAEKRKAGSDEPEPTPAPVPRASAAHAAAPKTPKAPAHAGHSVGDSVAGLIAAVRAAEGSLGKESTTQILSALITGK